METKKNVLCIRWSSYRASFTDGFQNFFRDETMVDVTLAAEGKLVKAHKVVLSVCSPYFKILLESTPCQHPTVLMSDIKYNVLSNMLEFMYNGQTKIKRQNIHAFLKLASKLQVKGLVDEAVKLLKKLMALKSRGVKKNKLKVSYITRKKKLKLLRRNKSKKKIKTKQKKKRSTCYSGTGKKSKQNVVEESVSRGSVGTSALTEDGIEHRDNNDNDDDNVNDTYSDDQGQNNNSSSDLLLDKNDHESTQVSSKSQKNLEIGIRDYIENFTIEDSEESDAHHDSNHAQNSFEYQSVHYIVSDVAHVSQSHKQNNEATYMEHTSQNQEEVDNVLPDNIQVTSQIPEEINLQSVSQNDMSKVLANSGQYHLQHEELNNALSVQSSIQNDVQGYSNSGQHCLQSHMQNLLLNNVPIAPPIDVDLPSRLTVQIGSPINDEYSQERNVQTAVPIDEQYSLQRTQNDLPNNVPYPSQSVVDDMQCPIQGDVHNASPSDGQYTLPRDVENISPFKATSPVNRDLQNNHPQDLSCSSRRMENASPNDDPYPVQNVVEKEVEYPIQTAAPIDVHYSLQGSLQDNLPINLKLDVENTSSNGVNYLSQKHLQDELPNEMDRRLGRSAEENLLQNTQDPLINEWQNTVQNNIDNGVNNAVNSYSKEDAHSGLTSDTQGVVLNNLQKDSQKSGEVILTSTSDLNRSRVQYVSTDEQKPEDSKSDMLDVRGYQPKNRNISLSYLKKDPRKNVQYALSSCTEFDEQNNEQDVIQNNPQENLLKNVQYDKNNMGESVGHNIQANAPQESHENAVKSNANIAEEVRFGSQIQAKTSLQNSAKKLLQNDIQGSQEKVKNAHKKSAKNVKPSEVQSTSQIQDLQNSAQRVLRSNLQDSKKKLQNVSKNDAISVDSNEVQSSSQSPDRMGSLNFGQSLIRSSLLDLQRKVLNVSKNDAISVDNSEVQSSSHLSEQRAMQSSLGDSKEGVQNLSKNDAISVDNNEIQSSSQSPDRIGTQTSGQRVMRSHLRNSKKISKNDAISVDSNEVQSSSKSPNRIGTQNFGQRVLRSNLRNSKKISKNDAISVDSNEVRSSSQSPDRMDSRNSGQRVLRRNPRNSRKKLRNVSKSGRKNLKRIIAKDSQKKASKRSTEIGEPSEVSQHEESSDERSGSMNELRKFLFKRAHSAIRSGRSNSEERKFQVVEQTKPEMVSEQSAHPRSIENPVLFDAQDEHSDDEHGSGDEHGELQSVLETEVQPKVQFASKRKAEMVENEEVELDSGPEENSDKLNGSYYGMKKSLRKGLQQTVKNDEKSNKSRVDTVTKTRVKISSQKTGQPFALQNDAEDSRKAAQYVPRRRPGKDEVQFLSQTESETDLQISERSVAQGKRHTVSQNKKKNDRHRLDRHVQCYQDNSSNDYEDSDDIPFIIDSEVKTKSSELEDVLRNIRLDTWESTQRKQEYDVIETSNDSIEVEKDTVDRSVLGNRRQKKPVKSKKEKLKDLEIRSISPEGVITECDVESDINSNVNSNDRNLTKFSAQYEIEEDSQTIPEVTVYNDEKNISRRKLPISQSMLEDHALNQVQYFSQNDVKNVAEGKAQCTSFENVLMTPHFNVPNVLQSPVKKTTRNVVRSKSSKKMRKKRKSAAKKRKKGTIIKDQFSLPMNVQENPPQKIPSPVKSDEQISFMTYSRRFFEKQLRKSKENFVGNDSKKDKPSESQSDSINDLLEIHTAPDQNAPSKSENDGNNNPLSEPQSVLETYAKLNLQIPIQIIFRSDVERSGLQSDEQSHDQKGQRRPVQYTFINNEIYLGESEKQFVGQNDLQENLKSNVSNGEAQSLYPDTPPVYPVSNVKYSWVTDLNNIARRTVQVVQDDEQMDLDSDVPNIVQRGVTNFVPSHVQHSVRNDVNKDASTDLPEAESHYQNYQEEGGQSYGLICDVKNFVQSGLQCILRFGPPEDEECATKSDLNQTDENYLQEYPNGVPRVEGDFNDFNNDCPAMKQSEEVIYGDDDRFGQVIEHVDIDTESENINERARGTFTSKAEKVQEAAQSTSNIDVETVDDDDVDDFHAFKTLKSGFQKNQRKSGAKRRVSSGYGKMKKKKK